MAKIADGVNAAHAQGIVHRDLKPHNVLLTADGTPKVTDFGLAKKGLGSDLTQTTDVFGTPAYMAPEQASGRTKFVGPEADVWALGVMLYELLSGTRPFDGPTPLQIMAAVAKAEVPKLRDRAPSVPADLALVTHKCLCPDPRDRYPTAGPLAADLRNWLDGKPVSARPAGVVESAVKWVKRNKRAALTGAGVLLTMATATAVSLGFGLDATEQRKQAEAAAKREADENQAAIQARNDLAMANEKIEQTLANEQRQRRLAEESDRKAQAAVKAEQLANSQAQSRLDQIEKVYALLATIFEGLSSEAVKKDGRRLEMIVLERLDQAVKDTDGELKQDPLAHAGMLNRFGLTYLTMGHLVKAIVLFERAQDILSKHRGPNHPDTLAALNQLASAYRTAGRWKEALRITERVLTQRQQVLEKDHPETMSSLHTLGVLNMDMGNSAEGLARLEQAYRLRKERLGGDHPDTLASLNQLAFGFYQTGQVDRAEPLMETVLSVRHRNLGDDHLDTLSSRSNLAILYVAVGKQAQAIPMLKGVIAGYTKVLGAEHPNTIRTKSNLASAYLDGGNTVDALPLLEEVLVARRKVLGDNHPDTIHSMVKLASAYQATGDQQRRVPLIEKAVANYKAVLGPDHPETLDATLKLAVAYTETGQGEKAVLLVQAVIAGERRMLGSNPSVIGRRSGSLAETGAILLTAGQHAIAEEVLRECLTIREKQEPTAWTTFDTQSLLGAALLGQKKYSDAESLLVKSLEGLQEREKDIPVPLRAVRLGQAADRLIALYAATEKPDKVKKYKELREKYRELLPPPRKAE